MGGCRAGRTFGRADQAVSIADDRRSVTWRLAGNQPGRWACGSKSWHSARPRVKHDGAAKDVAFAREFGHDNGVARWLAVTAGDPSVGAGHERRAVLGLSAADTYEIVELPKPSEEAPFDLGAIATPDVSKCTFRVLMPTNDGRPSDRQQLQVRARGRRLENLHREVDAAGDAEVPEGSSAVSMGAWRRPLGGVRYSELLAAGRLRRHTQVLHASQTGSSTGRKFSTCGATPRRAPLTWTICPKPSSCRWKWPL